MALRQLRDVLKMETEYLRGKWGKQRRYKFSLLKKHYENDTIPNCHLHHRKAKQMGYKYRLRRRVEIQAQNMWILQLTITRWRMKNATSEKRFCFVNDETKTHFVVMIPSKPSEYTFIIFYSPFSTRICFIRQKRKRSWNRGRKHSALQFTRI